MLIDIKHYLVQHQQTSLQDLALHFHTDIDAMRGMLQAWINKGKVRKCAAMTSCSGCSDGCLSASEGEMEVYEWIEKPIRVSQKPFQ